MIDKRKHYVMEKYYCYSDFDFYKNREGSSEVGRVLYEEISSMAGRELWAVVDTYKMKGKWDSHTVLVLQRIRDGLQIESGGYGWANVLTEHDKALKERRDYEKFLTALGELGKVCPVSCSRWFSDMVEHFTYTHEETLSYGDE